MLHRCKVVWVEWILLVILQPNGGLEGPSCSESAVKKRECADLKSAVKRQAMAERARHCIRDRRVQETSQVHAARDVAAERRARRAELQRRRRLRVRESTDPELVAKRQTLAERARQYIRDRRAQETPEEHAARLAARRAVRPAQYRAKVNAETAEQRARRLEAARMSKRDSRRRRAQQKALQHESAAMIFNEKVTNEPFGYAGPAHPGPDDCEVTITITTEPEEPAGSGEEFMEIPVTIEMGIGAEVSLPSTTRARYAHCTFVGIIGTCPCLRLHGLL